MSPQYTAKHPRSVYLLQMVGTNYYKIGIAGDVYARLRGIQVGSPIDIVLISSFEHEDAVNTERTLHRALQDCHVRGEWFECSYERVSLVFNAYVAPGLRTTLIEGTDEESVVIREFIAESKDRIENEGAYISNIAREVGVRRGVIYSLIKGRSKPKSRTDMAERDD